MVESGSRCTMASHVTTLFGFLLAASSFASVPCGDIVPTEVSRHMGNHYVFSANRPVPIELLITQLGYPVEVHEFMTDDGYTLRYHRIPFGKGASRSTRGPVLLQHGYLGSSTVWALTPDALAYTLADAGFDVWLGNVRGNTYCRRHLEYNPNVDSRFWNFSWHEMAKYDLPAAIDYILVTTGHSQLSYIGYSMGTTMFFTLGALRPDFMDKVGAAVLLAPVASPWHVRPPLASFLKSLQTAFSWLSTTFNMNEMFPHSIGNSWLNKYICAYQQFSDICEGISAYLKSSTYTRNDQMKTSLFQALQYVPAGASYKTLGHLAQIFGPGNVFREFDNDGKLGNQSTAKPYDLSKVTAPLYMYYAENDWLAVPEDVLRISKQLPNVKSLKRIADNAFGHLDFMWSARAKPLLYDDIVSTLLSPPQCDIYKQSVLMLHEILKNSKRKLLRPYFFNY